MQITLLRVWKITINLHFYKVWSTCSGTYKLYLASKSTTFDTPQISSSHQQVVDNLIMEVVLPGLVTDISKVLC